jgi:predicted ferric reductase
MKFGNFLPLILVILTINLYLLSKSDVRLIFQDPLLSISQMAALLGTVFLSYSFFLSSRLKITEKLYGGLDRVYRVHHQAGIIAYVLLLQHPLLLAINHLPDTRAALAFLFPPILTINGYGFIALVVMSALIIITLYLSLPYHLWKSSHPWIGFTMISGAFHTFLVYSDVSRFLPLRIYILSVCGMGIIMFLYKRFFYALVNTYRYNVASVNRIGDFVEISLVPTGKPMSFRAGQFAYIRFGKIGDRQEHPFSITSGPDEELLRFSVKITGDHTLALKDITPGTAVFVTGPHGDFSEKFFLDQPTILIAGGIGISPFLSMIKSVINENHTSVIYLYYCVRTFADALYHDELQNLSMRYKLFKYIPYISKENGRLTADGVIRAVDVISSCNIFLCGPPAMMNGLRSDFMKKGVKQYRIFLEDFSLR